MPRGFFGIGIYQPKHTENIGTLMRSAFCLGADFLFTIGRRYKTQSSDTVKAVRHIPYYHYVSADEWLSNLPYATIPVLIELAPNAYSLPNYCHPERAVYLLGNEVDGVPQKLLKRGFQTVQVPSRQCLNVSATGSIIMYDRISKGIS